MHCQHCDHRLTDDGQSDVFNLKYWDSPQDQTDNGSMKRERKTKLVLGL